MNVFRTTIVIPLYNRERFIRSTLRSAIDQTFPAEEIIVIDDGSTDSGPSIVAREFPGVKLVRIENNGSGPCRPRNVGVELARTEWITTLDSDDILQPHCLERQRLAFAHWPDAGLISTNFFRDYGDGVLVENNSFLLRSCARDVAERTLCRVIAEEAYSTMCRGNFLTGSANSFRKATWEAVGRWDESLSTSNDFDLFMRILRRCDLLYVDEPLFTYVFHEENISAANRNPGFKPVRSLNKIRVLAREAEHAVKAGDKQSLRAEIGRRSLELAWGYREYGDYWQAIRWYGRAFQFKGVRRATLRGLSGVPWRWLRGRWRAGGGEGQGQRAL